MAGWLALTLWMWGNSNPVPQMAPGHSSPVPPPVQPTAVAETASDQAVVRALLYADGRVDESLVRRTQSDASTLLSSAGVNSAWRICSSPDTCPPEQDVVAIVVILSSKDRPGGR